LSFSINIFQSRVAYFDNLLVWWWRRLGGKSWNQNIRFFV